MFKEQSNEIFRAFCIQMMSQQQMPYPAYLQNDLSTILTFVLPLFTVLSFAFIGIIHTTWQNPSPPPPHSPFHFYQFHHKTSPKIYQKIIIASLA